MAIVLIRPVGLPNGLVIYMEMPFFDELLAGKEKGRLPKDLGAHALWLYYGIAARRLRDEKINLVYEDEKSHRFDVIDARKILEAVCNIYGLPPAQVTRYWEAVDAQRAALGLTENADIPAKFRFRFN